MRKRLTDIVVKNAKPKGASYIITDDLLPGFGLRVGKNKKTWVVTFGQDRKRVSVGVYPLVHLTCPDSSDHRLFESAR